MLSPASSSQYFGINIHQGAVDPSTVTSAPPVEVMRHVLGVLQGMGVAITEESKFRFRCVRPLRRDSGASDRSTDSEESVNSVSSFVILSHFEYGNPGRSASRTGRLITGRMATGHQSAHVPVISRHSLLARQDVRTVVLTEITAWAYLYWVHHQDTLYGDHSEDSGGEVRFSVELTEISGLKSTYSLDIRRLKGPLRSYKYMYDSLRE